MPSSLFRPSSKGTFYDVLLEYHLSEFRYLKVREGVPLDAVGEYSLWRRRDSDQACMESGHGVLRIILKAYFHF